MQYENALLNICNDYMDSRAIKYDESSGNILAHRITHRLECFQRTIRY